jgi:hypothetical protein
MLKIPSYWNLDDPDDPSNYKWEDHFSDYPLVAGRGSNDFIKLSDLPVDESVINPSDPISVDDTSNVSDTGLYDDRPTLRTTSVFPRSVRSSQRIPTNAGIIAEAVDAINAVLAYKRKYTAAEWETRVRCDNTKNSDFRVCNDALDAVLCATFEPHPAPHDVGKSMNAAFNCASADAMKAISHGLSVGVIVSKQSDIDRVKAANVMSKRYDIRFIGFDLRLNDAIGAAPLGYQYPDNWIHYTRKETLGGIPGSCPPLHGLFVPSSFSEILCGRHIEPRGLYNSLLRRLVPGSSVICTWYDTDAMARYNTGSLLTSRRRFEILEGDSGKGDFGSYRIRVNMEVNGKFVTKQFTDYTVPSGHVEATHPDFSVETYPARNYSMAVATQRYPKLVPFLSLPECQMIMIGILRKEIPKPAPVLSDAPVMFRQISLADLDFEPGNLVNHGTLFGTRDILYHRPKDVYVAEKQDGVEAMLYIKKYAYVHFTGGAYWQSIHPITDNCELSVYQVECFGAPNDTDFRCIIVDALSTGGRSTRPFIARWRDLEEVNLPQWLSKQSWSTLDPMNIPEYDEGIVLQRKDAPPGNFSDGFGSARYVKRLKTVDQVNPDTGLVAEYDLDGKFVRDRKDLKFRRKGPNKEREIRNIREAWTDEEFRLVMSRLYSAKPCYKDIVKSVMGEPTIDAAFNKLGLEAILAIINPFKDTGVLESLFYDCSGDSGLLRYNRMRAYIVSQLGVMFKPPDARLNQIVPPPVAPRKPTRISPTSRLLKAMLTETAVIADATAPPDLGAGTG